MKPILFWAPRVLGITFVGLTLLLASDAFAGYQTVGQTLIAGAMHLVPTAIAAGLLIVAWKREVVGGVLYVATATGYAAWVVSANHPMSWTFVIAAPLFAAGALFVIDSASRGNRVRTAAR